MTQLLRSTDGRGMSPTERGRSPTGRGMSPTGAGMSPTEGGGPRREGGGPRERHVPLRMDCCPGAEPDIPLLSGLRPEGGHDQGPEVYDEGDRGYGHAKP